LTLSQEKIKVKEKTRNTAKRLDFASRKNLGPDRSLKRIKLVPHVRAQSSIQKIPTPLKFILEPTLKVPPLKGTRKTIKEPLSCATTFHILIE